MTTRHIPRVLSLLVAIVVYYIFSSFSGGLEVDDIGTLYEEGAYEDVIEKYADMISRPSFADLDCKMKGDVANLIGKSHYNLNQEEQALHYFKSVLYQYWHTCPEASRSDIANVYFNIGVCYQYLGQPYQGRPYIDTSLVILDTIAITDGSELFFKYQGAASLYSEIRDIEKAESFFKSAAQYGSSVTVVDRYYLDIELLSVYLKHKRYKRAGVMIDSIRYKYLNSVSTDFISSDIAIFHLNAAEYAVKTDAFTQGKEEVAKALQLISPDDHYLISNAYEILGVIHYELKEYELSNHYYHQAYELRREDDVFMANISQAFALENLAESQLAVGNHADALHSVDKAISLIGPQLEYDQYNLPIIRKSNVDNSYYLIRQMLLKQRILKAQYGVSSKAYIQATNTIIEKIDTLSKNALTNAYLDQSKLELLSDLDLPYSDFVDHYYEQYKTSSDKKYLYLALQQSTQAKGRLITDYTMLSQSLTQISQTPLYATYLSLKDQLSQAQRDKLTSSTSDADINESYAKLQVQVERVEQQIIDTYMGSQETQSFAQNLSYIRDKLNQDEVFIDIYTGEAYHYITYLGKTHIHMERIRAELVNPLLELVTTSLSQPAQPYHAHAASKLYDILLKTDEQHMGLQRIRHIFFAAHGPWSFVPIEALVDRKGDFLIANTEVSYTFNLNLLEQRYERRHYKEEYVGFGTTYSDSIAHRLSTDFGLAVADTPGRLVYATSEIEKVKQIFGGKAYVDTAASLANFHNTVSSTKVLHLSLHGLSDKDDGGMGSLVFDDRSPAYLLRAFELVKNPISAELIVLSACNTADGSIESGEGVIGISRSFLSGDVPHLVSSIWQASERAALNILPAFMRSYHDDQSPSEALRSAKLSYIEHSSPALRHPYYWANFIVYSKIDEGTRASYWTWLVLLGAVGLTWIGTQRWRRHFQ